MIPRQSSLMVTLLVFLVSVGCEQNWTIKFIKHKRIFEAKLDRTYKVSTGDDGGRLAIEVQDINERNILFEVRRYRKDDSPKSLPRRLLDRAAGNDDVLVSRRRVRVAYDTSRQISANMKIETWIESARNKPKFLINSMSHDKRQKATR